jgi:hypothetical protein
VDCTVDRDVCTNAEVGVSGVVGCVRKRCGGWAWWTEMHTRRLRTAVESAAAEVWCRVVCTQWWACGHVSGDGRKGCVYTGDCNVDRDVCTNA